MRGKPSIPQADIERAVQLRKAGKKWTEIAEELFVSAMGISRAVRRLQPKPVEGDDDFGADTIAAATVAEGQASEAPDAEF